jgi:hypothetical protein
MMTIDYLIIPLILIFTIGMILLITLQVIEDLKFTRKEK